MSSETISSESLRNKTGKEDGKLTKAIDNQITKIPTSFFILLAGGVVALSLGLAVNEKKKSWASYVGQWVPTLLLLGIYDKIVKTQQTSKSETKTLLH